MNTIESELTISEAENVKMALSNYAGKKLDIGEEDEYIELCELVFRKFTLPMFYEKKSMDVDEPLGQEELREKLEEIIYVSETEFSNSYAVPPTITVVFDSCSNILDTHMRIFSVLDMAYLDGWKVSDYECGRVMLNPVIGNPSEVECSDRNI